MKNVEGKIYEVFSDDGDKYIVKIKKVSDNEYDELTVDNKNKLYSIKRLQGKAEPTECDFDKCLANVQQLGYKQVEISELKVNDGVLPWRLDITDVELEVLLWCIRRGEVSIAAIQYKGRFGFNKAGRMLEWIKEKGYVDLYNVKDWKYKVTLTEEQFNAIYKQN